MSSLARKRWKCLAAILDKDKKGIFHDNIFTYNNFYYKFCNDNLWISIFDKYKDSYLFDITFTEPISSLTDLVGFNNTGNTKIWPSEELLSIYFQSNESLMVDIKNVCELGGGMTSFAGLFLNIKYSLNFVLLTDGNSRSVSNLVKIIKRNENIFKNCSVFQLVWNQLNNISDKWIKYFDLLLCCDCFYFTESHESLINCIDLLLSYNGKFVACAPSRNKTFESFVHEAQRRDFNIFIDNKFESQIKKNSDVLESYEPPIILILTRKSLK